MLRTRSFTDVSRELADEHRQVMDLIARIETPSSEVPLAKLLKSLHDLLVDHFAHEQFPGGLYECMGANGPEHHATLKILIREHCEILSAVRGLVEQAGLRPIDDTFRHEIGRVLEMLHDHETREHRLVQSIAGSDAPSA